VYEKRRDGQNFPERATQRLRAEANASGGVVIQAKEVSPPSLGINKREPSAKHSTEKKEHSVSVATNSRLYAACFVTSERTASLGCDLTTFISCQS
jgi:hypothetical protein